MLLPRLLMCAALVWITGSCPAQTGPGDDLLLPKPALVRLGTGGLQVQPSLTVALATSRSPRLQAATLRFLKRLEDKTGTPLPRAIGDAREGTIVLDVASDGEAVQDANEDESYSLDVTPARVHLKAATTVGALHGMATLLQLTQPVDDAYIIRTSHIQDSPRFRWRGLMIDCSRHFEPIALLKRNIDAMAAVKLNVFHWHLTDDQGFRIESKAFPKLTFLASDGKFYTEQEARDLVQYARERGIRVVPEIEMPGHSAAWLVAYPELNSGTEATGIRRGFGVSETAIDPTREETYQFLTTLLGEITTIFPDSYVHIGGDETPAPDWKNNPRIVSFMLAHHMNDNEALQAYFNTRVLAILTGLHRKMIGWDEIMHPDLPRDVVIQSWRGEESLAKGAHMGFAGVLSQPYYLDGMKPAGVHYLSDPVPAGTKLSAQEQQLILGGEVCMWSEHLDERTIESRIWPRTAAIAERFWSAQDVRDVSDMYRRSQATSVDLEMLGLRHLTSEDAGLRSLAETQQIDSLRTFAQAFEPVPFGGRYQEQHTSQLTPLTNFVDAVIPDPPVKHRLTLAVAQLTRTANTAATASATAASANAAAAELREYFRAVGASVPAVQGMMVTAPRLQSMRLRSEQLVSLSHIGLEAVQYLTAHQNAPASWKARSVQQVRDAQKPSAVVRFVFQDSLADLVQAVQ